VCWEWRGASGCGQAQMEVDRYLTATLKAQATVKDGRIEQST
jgi:hypothetical protein